MAPAISYGVYYSTTDSFFRQWKVDFSTNCRKMQKNVIFKA